MMRKRKVWLPKTMNWTLVILNVRAKLLTAHPPPHFSTFILPTEQAKVRLTAVGAFVDLRHGEQDDGDEQALRDDKLRRQGEIESFRTGSRGRTRESEVRLDGPTPHFCPRSYAQHRQLVYGLVVSGAPSGKRQWRCR